MRELIRLLLCIACSCATLGCQAPAERTPPTASQASCDASNRWRAITEGTQIKIISQLCSLSASSPLSSEPVAASWRIGANDETEWVLADGTVVVFAPTRLTQLQTAMLALQTRSDIDPRQKHDAAMAVASLRRKMSEMAFNLPQQIDIDATADALALSANTKAARMDALMVGNLVKRFAAEMLKALPADAVPPNELESINREISADRAAIAQGFDDLQAEIDPQRWRESRDRSTEN